jgi:hypothetical protein
VLNSLRFRLLAPLLLTTLLASACARPAPPLPADGPEQAWARFAAARLQPAAEPFTADASLYHTRETKTHRFRVDFYGNPATTLRLDLAAGIGTLLASVREDASGLLVYYPSDNKAYVSDYRRSALASLGVAAPFSLYELALALAGDLSPMVGVPASAEELEEGFAYEMQGGYFSRLVLDPAGRPERFEQPAQGVTLTFDGLNDPAEGSWFTTMRMDLAGGERLRLRLKEFVPRGPWPPGALDLELPEDASLFRLDADAPLRVE